MKDDWQKCRTSGQGLTETEIEKLRKMYLRGINSREAARQLECSTRTTARYYTKWRGEKIIGVPIDPVRKPGDKLLESEVVSLRAAFESGETQSSAARRLNISPSCVARWYGAFQDGLKHPLEETAAKRALPQRHYVGNFELPSSSK